MIPMKKTLISVAVAATAATAATGGLVAATAGAADPAPTASYSLAKNLTSGAAVDGRSDAAAASIVKAFAVADGDARSGPLQGDVQGFATTRGPVSVTLATDGDGLCWSGSFTRETSNIACTKASKIDPSLVSFQTISTAEKSWVVGVAPDGIKTVGALAADGTRGASLVSDNIVVVEVPSKAGVREVSWTAPDGSLKTHRIGG